MQIGYAIEWESIDPEAPLRRLILTDKPALLNYLDQVITSDGDAYITDPYSGTIFNSFTVFPIDILTSEFTLEDMKDAPIQE